MFSKIYNIALDAKSLEDLKNKIKLLSKQEPLSIDEKDPDNLLLTVSGRLAYENRHEQVEWMRLLGARINSIAQGYALAKNHAKVEWYREKFKASIDAIVLGYALAGDHSAVEWYQKEHNASIFPIAAGYAMAGNHEQVEIYRKTYKAEPDPISIVYAMAGYHAKVEEYRIEHKATASAIAYGYAMAGNHAKVEEYRIQHQANPDAIAQGYAMAGYHTKVEEYRIQHKADVKAIYKGYKLVENIDKMRQYDIMSLLDNYLEKRSAVLGADGKTKDYFYGAIPSFFQKSYAQKHAAVTALKEALESKNVDLKPHLSTLRNGTLGKELRQFIKSGLADDIVGKRVTTVSEFVEALQKKNAEESQYFSLG